MYRNKLVGCCGISRTNNPVKMHMCTLGYFVDQKYWGKGIASEAVRLLEKICFDELELQRVGILVAVPNVASWKVAEKCGYKREGRLNKYLNIRGVIYDCYLYAKVV